MSTETSKQTKVPPGVVGVVTTADGDVIASASDFIREAPGRFKLYEGQEQRLRQALRFKVVDAHCSPIVAHALDTYTIDQVFQQVQRKHGYRIYYVAVGHPPEAQEYFDYRSRNR